MKTLYVLAGLCMSLHAFAASAETPELTADDYPGYFSLFDDHNVGEELASRDITPDADLAFDPTTDTLFAINPDIDEDTGADVSLGIEQDDAASTGSLAEPFADEIE